MLVRSIIVKKKKERKKNRNLAKCLCESELTVRISTTVIEYSPVLSYTEVDRFSI